jgi:hypothetical protein
MEIKSLPPSFREQLVPTEPNAVDVEIAERIQLFCRISPDVEAAYICAAERTHEGEEPTHELLLGVKLTIPVNGPGDSGTRTFELTRRFSAEHPDLLKRLGFRVLADRAVPAFEHYGLQVYALSNQ